MEAAALEDAALDPAAVGARRGENAQIDRIPPDSLKNDAQTGRLPQ